MTDDHHTAHVIDSDGVTPTRFVRDSDDSYSNVEEIVIKPGGVLDLGGGLIVGTGQIVTFTCALELEL